MRTKKTTIVLVSGKAGAGKTTVSDMLRDKIKTDYPELIVERYSFSSPIKYIAQAFFTWDKEKDEKGRRLLQDLGKVGREYNENVWVKHLLAQMDKHFGNKTQLFPTNVVIVDDWRFPNEMSYLQINPMIDVFTVRVSGRGGLEGQVALDVSENSLPEGIEFGYDNVINNNQDLELLDVNVELLLHQIAKQYIVE